MPDRDHTRPPAAGDAQHLPLVDRMRGPAEPVPIDLYVDVILTDFEVTAAYERARRELDAKRHDLDRLDWTAMPGTRGAPNREQRERRYRLTELRAALDWQQDLDWRRYGQRLAANLTAAASELGVPVVVTVDLHSRPEVWPQRGDGTDDVAWDLVVTAVERTPLPGAGRSPLQRLGSRRLHAADEQSRSPSSTRVTTAQRCSTSHGQGSSRGHR